MRRLQQVSTAMACVLALAVLGGCSSNKTVGETVDDAAITAKVKTKLAADPTVNPFRIDVDTTDGVVRLSGTVNQSGDRTQAERIARDTEGVRRVVNDINVGQAATLGQEVDCARIVSDVKARLAADPTVAANNIDVDCEKGAVTLSGQVSSPTARDTAVRISRDISGVSSVQSRLTVGGSGG